ncbi:hypothetical protein SAMN05192558_115144 [Actinokineospora alba]|uniref:Uncharacterized protein n=1 Tax=Actinokineospora alba TaxID=504798 RepID=A0A1H0VUD1_9PSEU|nr:hypothetical protein C8E96_5656 [Actinokineospora alba]SDI40164.1 hypothetical protein SAMN05421871_104495 [Actinokineospora alba]SDP82192.1 hypothetical protein SAMN05192558_115144 [Actinokineospora alba]
MIARLMFNLTLAIVVGGCVYFILIGLLHR